MNIQKLNSAISAFIKKKEFNSAYYEENWAEAKSVKNIISHSQRISF